MRLLTNRGRDILCEIVGDGPMRADLDRLVGELRLEGVVILTGSLQLPEVIGGMRGRPHSYRRVSSLPTATGTESLTPSWRRSATAGRVHRHLRNPEVVRDGETGPLVEEANASAIADAVERLFDDHDLATTLGDGGPALVHREIDLGRNVNVLLDHFAAV